MNSLFADAGVVMVKWLVGLMLALLALPLLAGTFAGTVKSFDADSRTVVVEGTKNSETKTFEIPAKATIFLNNKKSDLDAVTEGASVSVLTDTKNQVTRINVKLADAKTGSAGRAKTDGSTDAKDDKASSRAVVPGDWPNFCGPSGDNVSSDTMLLKSWPEGGPRQVWKAEGLGEGYSSVSVADGLVFTMGNVGPKEAVTAVSLETGETVWQQVTASRSDLSAGNGPRGTPTYDEGRLYALGGNGDLTCHEAPTGKIVWKKNILNEFGGRNITWGISESVLIDGDKLICSPGGKTGSVVALNKKTGKVIWRCVVPGQSPAGYSTAIIAQVGGVRQYIQFLHAGVVGVRADNGDFLWSDSDAANGTANCSSPLFADNMVFYASGYSTGGAMVKLGARGRKIEATRAYHTDKMQSHHGGMVLLDGHVYGSSDPGILRCLEMATGQVKWENRSVGKGAITCADGFLYVRSENGPVALVEATPEGYTETGRFEQPDRSGANAWAHPVVAHGKLLLRDQDILLAYDIKAQ